MPYKGRVAGVVLVIVNGMFLVLASDGLNTVTAAVGSMLLLIVGWFTGRQFDRIIQLNQTLKNTKADVEQKKEEYKKSKEEMQSIFTKNYSLFWRIDLLQEKMGVSKGIEQIFGFAMQEFEENYNLWFERVHPDDQDTVEAHYQRLLAGEESTAEWRFFHKDGKEGWVYVFGDPEKNDKGEVVKLNGVAYDLTERKNLEQAINQAQEDFQQLLDNVNACIYRMDEALNMTYMSRNVTQIYGFSPENDEGFAERWKRAIHPEDFDRLSTHVDRLLDGQYVQMEYRVIQPDGGIRWVEDRCTPIFKDAEPVEFHGVLVDITKRKKAEDQVKHMAYHDVLTGLPNRSMFNDELQKALVRCERKNHSFAVMFIDLDRFKFINDVMGHHLGDELLIQVGERLLRGVRQGDVVARQGGDEFIILLEDSDADEAKAVAERILDEFSIPFTLDGEDTYTSPSIGISLYPRDGQNNDTLIKRADAAMYMAKKYGKNNYHFYIPEEQGVVDRRITLERGLKKALRNQEFELHYQPKVELKTGEIYGVEALLRWQHPELGLVSPVEFIPLAEASGMIVPIGKWVLEQACNQNKEWQKNGYYLKVAVNVSVLQFENNHFVEDVKNVLAEHELAPQYLTLEITESVMQNIDQSKRIIQELGDIGVTFAIDDFGTGYASLSAISKLPVSVLKLDKSFVSEVVHDAKASSLVKTMLDMGGNLDVDLVAEGIETEQQVEFLLHHGGGFGQGYFYSPPVPAAEAEELLKEKLANS
ncbi:bifunctional diguanylate cyclase/phosphodiesterase [Salsuginibacillus kocurii]|uniref:bifunctional diguanylate cyclase/phosphodiesterase n=1 Tax=Salsuginibacillus kocurii TaxID=427078 RepID=UPI00035C8A60|nr:bifunctional diguanylate cyclase/phosphodiesterase [Salsuginibacillus kocurii]